MWYTLAYLQSRTLKKSWHVMGLHLSYHHLYMISGDMILLHLGLGCCYFPAKYTLAFIKNNKRFIFPVFCGIFKTREVLATSDENNLCWTMDLNCSSSSAKCRKMFYNKYKRKFCCQNQESSLWIKLVTNTHL